MMITDTKNWVLSWICYTSVRFCDPHCEWWNSCTRTFQNNYSWTIKTLAPKLQLCSLLLSQWKCLFKHKINLVIINWASLPGWRISVIVYKEFIKVVAKIRIVVMNGAGLPSVVVILLVLMKYIRELLVKRANFLPWNCKEWGFKYWILWYL